MPNRRAVPATALVVLLGCVVRAGDPGADALLQAVVPQVVVCDPRNPKSASLYETAVVAQPGSLAWRLALAQCYDTAWRFADADRVISDAREIVFAESKTQPRPTGDARVFAGAAVSVPAVVRPAGIEYPKDAVDAGVTGTVAVELRVDRGGSVHDVKIVESVPGLDKSAVAAVRALRFQAPRVNDQPADVWLVYFVRFGLPEELMPADWLDRARVYSMMGLYEQALVALDAALGRTRKDRLRLGDTGAASLWPRTGRAPGNVTEPRKIRDRKPIYPIFASARKIQGLVIIEALIDQFGEVARARVLKGVPMLDAAALDAVRGWAYTPTMVEGKSTAIVMTATVTFSVH